MANTTQEVAKYDICFIQTGDSWEESTEILKQAFDAVDTSQFEPLWITVADCLKISKKEPKLFVLDPFEGVAFEHLKTFQCRIVGPLSILYCLQYGEILPKRAYPIYSVSMRKITVSCSNIQAKLRDEICSKVQLMGGFFSKDLTKSVTHLVVGEVGSQKYKVAANFGLPIMVPEWVADVWENGQFKQLHASDAYFDKYKCPVFKGLVITVSQLSAEERLTIKRVIEDNGGSYSGALKANETTHLILNEPTGDKYRFAKNWKVICVNVKWIYESVEAGYCRDEALYGIDESVQIQPKRSTPKKDLTSCDLPLVDCSAIVGGPTVSHLDETMRSDISLPASNRKNSYLPLDDFNLSSLPKYGQFLDGCKIFLTGFSSPRMDKLRKIVNSGGGMRFSKYSDSISHVVCGDLSEEFLQNIRSSAVKPYVVNYKWLLECCKNAKLVEEKPYLCVDVTTLSPEKNPESEPKKDISIHISQSNSQPRKDDFTNDNMTDIFKQYINEHQPEDNKENKGNTSDNRNNSLKSKTLTTDARKNHFSSFEVKCNDKPEVNIPVVDLGTENEPQAEVENDIEIIDNDVTSSSENLFSGIKFIIVGFGEKDSEILSSMIETHSGVISSQCNTSADIAIVPLIWYDLNISVSNIVTNCWLQKCIEETRIFDFDENELFRPLAVATDKKPFEPFVISFSQYVGTERDCLIHLAESLGATCQEYFVRKANAAKGVLANTHLVVSIPDGSKYEASKKWKIPAVTKQWVIDTAKSGVVPPLDNYLVERFPDFPLCDKELTVQDGSAVPEKGKKSSIPEKKIESNVGIPHISYNDLTTDPCNDRSGNVVKKSSSVLQTDCVPVIENVANDEKLPEIQNVGERFPSMRLQHSRVVELCNESRLNESMNKSSPIRPLGDSSLNASLNLDQTHNFKFHVSGILNDLDASSNRDSFGGNKRHSLPVEEMFSKNLASALRRIDDKSSFDKGDSRVLEENNADEKSRVLDGVVVYVSRKLSDIQIELNEIVVQLGGSYVWSYNDSCTHFVFTGKQNDITKEFREARSRGKKIVSPEWVYACREKEMRVEEELYPHTYKANMTLSQQISITKAPIATTDDAPKVCEEIAEAPKNVESPAEAAENVPEKDEEADFNKQLTELLVLAKSAKKRQSKRAVNSTSSSPVPEISPVQQKLQRHLSDVFIRPAPVANDNASEEPDTGSQHSQSYPITWDDPTGRLEREKIAARAAKNAELNRLTTESESNNKTLEDLPLDSGLDEKTEKPQTRKFMFTNIADSVKAEYVEIIKKLGGLVSDEKAFDITATHLILSNPIKNEKFLSSVASGKWVLHPLYLSASVEQNKFACEEEYEWGGPSTEKFLKNLSTSSAKIAECPHRWRSKLQGGLDASGAFNSWRVMIVADDPTKLATYSKILESGGAEIIPSETPENALENVTHVFVDVKKRSANRIDLTKYTSRNIKCIKPEYLAFYLIEDPPPDVDNFLLESKDSVSGSSAATKRRNLSTATRQSKRTRLK